jgi:hypothetical protein
VVGGQLPLGKASGVGEEAVRVLDEPPVEAIGVEEALGAADLLGQEGDIGRGRERVTLTAHHQHWDRDRVVADDRVQGERGEGTPGHATAPQQSDTREHCGQADQLPTQAPSQLARAGRRGHCSRRTDEHTLAPGRSRPHEP